jgi:DMSO/TMAO reductase YedYZ molybdopterin-dependent catalytic subunit
MAVSRSRFLGVAAAGTAGAALGLPLRATAAPEVELRQVVSRPYDLETPLRYMRTYLTPTDALFMRSHFGPPGDWPPPNWSLQVGGEVDSPATLTLDEIRALPNHTVTMVLQCAGNGRSFYRPRPAGGQWTWGAVGNVRWTGVRLKDVLDRAKMRATAQHVGSVPADHAALNTPHFNRSIPLAKATDDDTILAYELNGQPISVEHGGPLRLIVPGWAGDNSVKWLTSIAAQVDETHGFYMDTAYRYPNVLGDPGVAIPASQTHHIMEMPVKSMITNPLDGQTLKAGVNTMQGVAFSGYGRIKRVEVSADGGQTWSMALLGIDNEKWAWRLWTAAVTLPAGPAKLMARAFDSAGNSQPASQQWNPSGYYWNVYHAVDVEVSA